MTPLLRGTIAALTLAPALALAQPSSAPSADTAPSIDPAATVALVTGSVTANGAPLSAGDAVYERQVIVVGPNSYANLRFADGGRILLRPNSEFAVETYRYAGAAPAADAGGAVAPAPAPAAGTAFFRLVRGGFRAISGLIGKADRQQYRVTTPAATIGIRGTDYEVQICTHDCPAATGTADAGATQVATNDLSGLQLAQASGPAGGGVVVATNDGSISLRTSRGEFVVDVGQVALALANGQTFMLPAVPDVLLVHPTPSPEACE